jgi:hypothetical protein
MTELPGPSFCSPRFSCFNRGSPPKQLYRRVSIYSLPDQTGVFHYLSPAYHGPDPHATAVTSRLESLRPCAKVRGGFVGVVAVVGCPAGTVFAPAGSTAEVAVRTGEAVIFGMTLYVPERAWTRYGMMLILRVGLSFPGPCELHLSSRSAIRCRLLR